MPGSYPLRGNRRNRANALEILPFRSISTPLIQSHARHTLSHIGELLVAQSYADPFDTMALGHPAESLWAISMPVSTTSRRLPPRA